MFNTDTSVKGLAKRLSSIQDLQVQGDNRSGAHLGRPAVWALLIGVVGIVTVGASRASAADVVEAARSFPDGGGYKWQGTGVLEEIAFRGETILAKGESTYCCGFTFAVAMKAAAERGLLQDKSVDQVRAFQKHWYGATEESRETQVAYAVATLGIGRPVAAADAQPGDFLQFWRANGSGHSVVFLHWIRTNGRAIGFRYRSSQESTDGIGDRTEYFADVAERRGRVDRERLYFARLDEQP